MGKQAGKIVNLSLGGVALEGYAKNVGLDFTQELPDVTSLSDVGGRVVVGNNKWSVSIDGDNDFAAGAADATFWGFMGSTAVHALAFQPAGTTETADTPNYDATDLCMRNYSIKAAVGGAVTFTAAFDNNSSMSRNTT